MTKTNELTYDQAADILGFGPRHVRRVLQRNGIRPIRHGHRTVGLPEEKIYRLKIKLVREEKSHHQPTNGHGQTNGKGRR